MLSNEQESPLLQGAKLVDACQGTNNSAKKSDLYHRATVQLVPLTKPPHMTANAAFLLGHLNEDMADFLAPLPQNENVAPGLFQTAAHYYRIATILPEDARLSVAQARFSLARLLLGQKIPAPDASSHPQPEYALLIKESAKGGWPFAQIFLSQMYVEGADVQKNLAFARKWLIAAGESTHRLDLPPDTRARLHTRLATLRENILRTNHPQPRLN